MVAFSIEDFKLILRVQYMSLIVKFRNKDSHFDWVDCVL